LIKRCNYTALISELWVQHGNNKSLE